MTIECVGCFAFDARQMKCHALEDTNFPYPCPFRKDKVTKKQGFERTCKNCFAYAGEERIDCAILIKRYIKNCPFHKTRYEYEKGVKKYDQRKTI